MVAPVAMLVIPPKVPRSEFPPVVAYMNGLALTILKLSPSNTNNNARTTSGFTAFTVELSFEREIKPRVNSVSPDPTSSKIVPEYFWFDWFSRQKTILVFRTTQPQLVMRGYKGQ